MKAKWLSFNIKMPIELNFLYDFLQSELNFFLSDKTSRQAIESIDYSKHKGKVWLELGTHFRERVKTWPIKNKAWYANMMYENIRREVQSKRENVIIFDELVNNDFKIDEALFSCLVEKYKIYATRGRISNLKRSNKSPKLPNSATFQLDYTVSAPQNFKMSDSNLCEIQNADGSWISYQIIMPASLNGNITNKVAKPRFFKRKRDGKYIGICSYEYIPEAVTGDSILGVDIGQIKLFSAVALHKSGKYSNEYTDSISLKRKNEKLKRLYKKKQSVYAKHERLSSYNNDSLNEKIETLTIELQRISLKIENLKTNIARLVASEVISVAKKEKCNSIHIENLSWMSSLGGKWNHSQTHNFIEEASVRAGIKCEKVNAAYTSSEHPITGERGIKSNRTVTFSDGKEIDRDLLGALNIAKRNKGKKRDNKISSIKKGTVTPKRIKPDKSKRQKIKELFKDLKKNSQIVVFSPQSPDNKSTSLSGLWSLSDRVISNSSLLTRQTMYQLVT